MSRIVRLGVPTIVLLTGALVLQQGQDDLAALEREARAFSHYESHFQAPTGNDRGYWPFQHLQTVLARVLGVEVHVDVTPEGYAGITTHDRAIVIDQELSWDARFQVLAHEAGHIMQPGGLSGSEREVFAEAVAYLLLQHFDVDSFGNSSRYLSRHKQSLHVLRDYRMEIDYAVAVLRGRT